MQRVAGVPNAGLPLLQKRPGAGVVPRPKHDEKRKRVVGAEIIDRVVGSLVALRGGRHVKLDRALDLRQRSGAVTKTARVASAKHRRVTKRRHVIAANQIERVARGLLEVPDVAGSGAGNAELRRQRCRGGRKLLLRRSVAKIQGKKITLAEGNVGRSARRLVGLFKVAPEIIQTVRPEPAARRPEPDRASA